MPVLSLLVVPVLPSDAARGCDAVPTTELRGVVASAVRRLRQDKIGTELRGELTDEEVSWLIANLG